MSWVNKISKSLKEVRMIISPSKQSNAQIFAHKYVPQFRQHNPSFPFIIRECEGVDEFMIFRYDYGVEKKELLQNKSLEDIENLVLQSIDKSKDVNQTL